MGNLSLLNKRIQYTLEATFGQLFFIDYLTLCPHAIQIVKYTFLISVSIINFKWTHSPERFNNIYSKGGNLFKVEKILPLFFPQIEPD